MAGLENYLADVRVSTIGNGNWSQEDLRKTLMFRPRIEKLGTDLSLAVSRLQQTMTVLEASQASFTRLAGLSLFALLR